MITKFLSNKKIRLAFIAILTIIMFWSIISYFKIFSPKIRFESEMSDHNFILIYPNKTTEVKFTTPFEIKLDPGDYYVKSDSENYSNLPQKISIKQSQTIKLDFDYSSKYYDEKFSSDIQKIHHQITTTYPKTIQNFNFSIITGQFFQGGKYYVTAIGEINAKSEEADDNIRYFKGNIYHIIFQKVGDNWQQVTHPELILTSTDYPNLPQQLIKEINNWEY